MTDRAPAERKANGLILPRRPSRANGHARYNLLVETAEKILKRDGTGSLSIQTIAQEACVPTASVYHFFPHTSSASIAVAERYFEAIGRLASRPVRGARTKSWQESVEILIRRVIKYYSENDYARRLILGSDFSWHVRKAELTNNKILASHVYGFLCENYGLSPVRDSRKAIAIAISIGESVWMVSIAEEDKITAYYVRESISAVIAYLSPHFEGAVRA